MSKCESLFPGPSIKMHILARNASFELLIGCENTGSPHDEILHIGRSKL